MGELANGIEKGILEQVSNTGNSIAFDNYNKILSLRRKMTARINKIKKHLEFEEHKNKYELLVNQNKETFDDQKKEELRGWINAKFKNSEKQLLNDFRGAYSLVEEVRTLVTGEDIKYIVIEESLDESHIDVIELNSRQMLKNLSLNYNSLSKYSGNILSSIKTVEKVNLTSRYENNVKYSKTSPLYTSLARMFQVADPTYKTFNKGNRWEIYYYFLNKYGNDNTPVKTVDEFMYALSAAKGGYAWYKGGDVDSYQVKSSGASLTSFNSVVTALESTLVILTDDKLNISQQVKELEKLFSVSKEKEIKDIAKRLETTTYLEIEERLRKALK